MNLSPTTGEAMGLWSRLAEHRTHLGRNMAFYAYTTLGVSKNRGGPPKSSILIGFSLINHPFGGTIIFGNTPIQPVYIHYTFPWNLPYLIKNSLLWEQVTFFRILSPMNLHFLRFPLAKKTSMLTWSPFLSPRIGIKGLTLTPPGPRSQLRKKPAMFWKLMIGIKGPWLPRFPHKK